MLPDLKLLLNNGRKRFLFIGATRRRSKPTICTMGLVVKEPDLCGRRHLGALAGCRLLVPFSRKNHAIASHSDFACISIQSSAKTFLL
jgi:hypothetical protein